MIRAALGLLAVCSVALVCHAAQEQPVPVVDDARMLAAAGTASDWLLYGRDFSNTRYSPLARIDAGNVHELAPRWIYQSGENATFQATPLVADGVMYLSLPWSSVVAVDARTGREIWRYQHQRRSAQVCCGPANRGVALAYGRVYVATVDARLIALDARSGKPVWDVTLAETNAATESAAALGADAPLARQGVTGSTGVGAVMAPLVFGGRVIVGITGVGYGLHLDRPRDDAPFGAVVGVEGHYGRPGFLAAFDAATGARVWQFDTIPESGWEGAFSETTPDGIPLNRDVGAELDRVARYPDAARYGGGSVASAIAFDPERDLIFFGTGNPSPQMDDETRPGDNLHTSSLVALNVRTGALVWAYQQVPHDVWGYDVASPPVLLDLRLDGQDVPTVAQASKLGWVYVHDRLTGRLLFKSEPFVPQANLFAHATAEGVRIAPGATGGANWSPTALDPRAGILFVPALHLPMRYRSALGASDAGGAPVRYTSFEPSDEPTWGTLTALDLAHQGRILWQVRTDQPLVGGVLATAGGLVFTGEGDGNLSAFDARRGQRLWQFQCGAGVNAPPVTYEIDGVQYVTVAAGGSKLFGYRQGGAVVAFALPPARDVEP